MFIAHLSLLKDSKFALTIVSSVVQKNKLKETLYCFCKTYTYERLTNLVAQTKRASSLFIRLKQFQSKLFLTFFGVLCSSFLAVCEQCFRLIRPLHTVVMSTISLIWNPTAQTVIYCSLCWCVVRVLCAFRTFHFNGNTESSIKIAISKSVSPLKQLFFSTTYLRLPVPATLERVLFS